VIALYNYNVSASDRAMAIAEELGETDPDEINEWVQAIYKHPSHAATLLPYPVAHADVVCAFRRYGDEATQRVNVNRTFYNQL
jgi:hypothetical protein